jgi:hypothetical protein
MQELGIAGQGQPRFLQARTSDPVRKAIPPGDQMKPQTVFLVPEEIINGKVDGIQ